MTQAEFKPIEIDEDLEKRFGNQMYVKFQIMQSYTAFTEYLQNLLKKEYPKLNKRQSDIVMTRLIDSFPQGLFEAMNL